MPEGGVHVTKKDRTADILKGITELARTKVLVGIPEENTDRQDGPATNALLGYVHEFGSPARNIPPRPWLIPGAQNGLPQALDLMKTTAQAGLSGNATAVYRGLNAVGLTLQNTVRARISSNIPPPLAPSTIANRRRRSTGSAYRRKATTASDTTTLIDTGQLRNSISYTITKS